ncbi:hypothetical protein ONZ45_g15999 [Pleurotus djamor]|nr:hypothetical protein ONZ45_g15999 [Pleurotus djamor]
MTWATSEIKELLEPFYKQSLVNHKAAAIAGSQALWNKEGIHLPNDAPNQAALRKKVDTWLKNEKRTRLAIAQKTGEAPAQGRQEKPKVKPYKPVTGRMLALKDPALGFRKFLAKTRRFKLTNIIARHLERKAIDPGDGVAEIPSDAVSATEFTAGDLSDDGGDDAGGNDDQGADVDDEDWTRGMDIPDGVSIPSNFNLITWNVAAKAFWNGLPKHIKKEKEALANAWRTKGLPDNDKRRLAEKDGQKALVQMTESLYKQYGMVVMMFASYVQKDGRADTLFAQTRQGPVVPMDAIEAATVDSWHTVWTQKIEPHLGDHPTATKDGSSKQKEDRVVIEKDESGNYVVPDPSKLQTPTTGAKHIGLLVRQYVKKVHHECTGLAAPSWFLMSLHPERYLHRKFLPDAFVTPP